MDIFVNFMERDKSKSTPEIIQHTDESKNLPIIQWDELQSDELIAEIKRFFSKEKNQDLDRKQ